MIKTIHERVDEYRRHVDTLPMSPVIKEILVKTYVDGMCAMEDALNDLTKVPEQVRAPILQLMRLELRSVSLSTCAAAVDALDMHVAAANAENEAREIIAKVSKH